MTKIRLLIVLTTLSAIVAACASRNIDGGNPEAGEVAVADADGSIHITLVGINDLHGALLDRPVVSTDTSPRKGGAAMISAYVQAIRAENPDGTLLVDAGDMLQGPLLCNHFEGAPVADFYKHVQVEAAALGNHEFDYGPVGPSSRVEKDGDDPLGALEQFAARGGYPILAANVRAKGDGALPDYMPPTHLVEVKGVKVGLIGLAPEDTPSVTAKDNIVGLDFDAVGPVVEREVKALREAGAEVIVVLGHLDGGCRGDGRWPPVKDCTPDGELVGVLDGADGEVDAVLLGHRHVWISSMVDGVAVTESGSRGRALSRIDLYIDAETRRADRARTEVHEPIALCEQMPEDGHSCFDYKAKGPWYPAVYNDRPIQPDAEVDAVLDPYFDQIRELCSETLATAALDIRRGGDGQSAAGTLVADAMLAHVPGADLALLNSGSLRDNLPAGDLNLCHFHALFPFDNRVVVVQFTGAELETALEIVTSGSHSFVQLAGISLVVDPGDGTWRDIDGDGENEAWERDRLISAETSDGKSLDPARMYTVVLPDYLWDRPDSVSQIFGDHPADRVNRMDDNIRDGMIEYVSAYEGVLGDGGGWPIPDKADPRVRFEQD